MGKVFKMSQRARDQECGQLMPKVKGKTIISASRDVPVADPQRHMTCQKFSSAEASYGAIIQSLGTCHTRAVQKKKTRTGS